MATMSEIPSNCTEFHSPQRFADITTNFSSGYVKSCKKMEPLMSGRYSDLLNQALNFLKTHVPSSSSNKRKRDDQGKFDLGGGVRVEFFNVSLNGAPFFDFFAKGREEKAEEEAEAQSVPVAKKRRTDARRSSVGNNVEEGNCESKEEGSMGNSVGNNAEDFEPCIAAVPLSVYVAAEQQVVNLPQQVNWTIVKKLFASDCNDQHRIIIGKQLMADHILPYLDAASEAQIYTDGGLRVDVFDCDTGTAYKLSLKQWRSSKSHSLVDNWKRDFVVRRNLQPEDTIGLCWEQVNKRLLFSVLGRAQPVVQKE